MIKNIISKCIYSQFCLPLTLLMNNLITEITHIVYVYSKPPPPPPPRIKQWLIKKIQKKYLCDQFIETGTFFGNTTFAVISDFKKLHTIELSKKLYINAVKRFSQFKKVHIYQGDSGKELNKILKNNIGTTLFWLDGHYSEGITAKGSLNTPIEKELACIKKYYIKGSVIMIDDARNFIGKEDYPTLLKIQEKIFQIDNNLTIFVQDDIIFAVPEKK